MTMKTSEHGRHFIQNFEGFRATPYKAHSSEVHLTIGFGHYGPDVKQGMVLTRTQADELFKKDLLVYEKHVNSLGMDLNQNEFDALVSFDYNCGYGNLLRLCSDRNKNSIIKWLPAYNKAGGQVLAGLTRRRNEEVKLFKTPVTTHVSNSVKKDEYFTTNPKRVLTKVEIGIYKDVDLKELVRRYNAGTPFTIVGVEKSKGGTPRLKTASKYYISANKKYVKQG